MKPEEIDKLFRFFGKISSSNHLNRGGMGFGLTITKMIIHQLEGNISVESQVLKGSKFIADIKVDEYIGQPRPSYLSMEETKSAGGGAVPITRSDIELRFNNDNISGFYQSRHFNQSSNRSNLIIQQEV